MEPALTADPAAAIPITVTRFHSVKAPSEWTDEHTTWGAFVAGLEITPYLAKEHAPLHALYRLRRGGHRCNEDVEQVFGVCLDFDGQPAENVIRCVEKLQADGVAVLWHTTWSHGQPLDPTIQKHRKRIDRLGSSVDQCRRLIIPLAEPLPARQYDTILGTIWGRYADAADRSADGVHRAFYVPSRHPDRTDCELHYLEGAGLRVSDLTPPLAPVLPAQHAVGAEVWQRLASRWLRAPKPAHVDLGSRMGKILQGLPYAEHGERDTVTWRLCQAIVHAYPDVDRQSVKDLFRLSIDAMRQSGSSLTEAELGEKLERARRAELAQADTLLPEDRRRAIEQCFGADRDTPYTDAEIDAIAKHVGLDRDRLAKSWILQFRSEYWLIGPAGKLWCATRDDLENTARVVLSPTPVELHEITPMGRQWLGRRKLLELYSLPLDDVARSLVLSEPAFDLPNRRLTMPTCPIRKLEPRFDPEIDAWLRVLGGSKYDNLCAWLQWVPSLDRPLAALIVTGPKSTGKSLLAQGVSRLWSTGGPTDLADAMGQWDQLIERCPYCFADEGRVPRDVRGYERTDDLREFIQCTRRVVNAKFRQPVTLEGATRTQIAANNLDVLTLGGNLSGHDVDAIAARFLHVPADARAAQYLEARGGRDGAQPWVEGDGLARHVLWLAERRLYPWTGRFGIEQQPELVDRMLVRGGYRAMLCELIVKAIRDETALRDGAIVAGGEFACRLDWISEHWDVYMRRERKPATATILQALDGLGYQITEDGEGWFVIATRRLAAWAREAGVGVETKLHEWMSRHET